MISTSFQGTSRCYSDKFDRENVSPYDVDYAAIQKQLLKDKQKIELKRGSIKL
jgi:hypothetical protein